MLLNTFHKRLRFFFHAREIEDQIAGLQSRLLSLAEVCKDLRRELKSRDQKLARADEKIRRGGGRFLQLENHLRRQNLEVDRLRTELYRLKAPSGMGPARCVVVLGMHRSGTSMLGGLLHLLGCAFGGGVKPPSEHNQKGFFENVPLVQLNDEILRFLGLAWNSAAALPEGWRDGAEKAGFPGKAREMLVSEFGDRTPVGIKDPRLCRLLPFWLPILEARYPDLRFILVFRHPENVARSLVRRDGMAHGEAVALWKVYYREALAHVESRRPLFVHYDTFFQDSVDGVHKVQFLLGLPEASPTPEMEMFLSKDLMHERVPVDSVVADPEAQALYERLRSLAKTPVPSSVP